MIFKMKNSVLVVFACFLAVNLAAQVQNIDGAVVTTDPRIDSLLNLHIAYNEEYPVIDGYRIHIFIKSGNEALVEAEEVKLEFEEKYEFVPAYITFGEPYYRVRVGDFRTRLEAEKFLQKINRTYPNAWVTRDKINLPDLPNYPKTNKYE
jgi:hypothetical protein